MATMSIRIADDDKVRADVLFKALGLTTNATINMFIKQCIRTLKKSLKRSGGHCKW